MVVVGGVDPGGGAGLLRDAATAAALGASPVAVGTAWTEQRAGTHLVEPREPAAVANALARAIADLQPSAVKIGMAVGPATAAALIQGLGDYPGPVVVDPVLATSRGGPLWDGPPGELFALMARATLVTPNAPEAALLTGLTVADLDQAEAAARALMAAAGVAAVLVKGGHLSGGASVVDVLVCPNEVRRFAHPRRTGPSPRGTGCALATAIAVALGRGLPLARAVGSASDWLAGAIAAARPVAGELHLGVPGGD